LGHVVATQGAEVPGGDGATAPLSRNSKIYICLRKFRVSLPAAEKTAHEAWEQTREPIKF
jgi:hypothetical protein